MIYNEELLFQEMIDWRRILHQHPEVSYEEYETSKWLKSKLIEFGGFQIDSVGETSFVATIKGKGVGSHKVIAFRTDIDALPVTEETGLTFASQNEGVMHACGHDTHMSMLVALAKVLSSNQESFSTTIKLIFQSAEEVPPGGAVDIVKSGLLDDVDYVYGFHIFPNHPVGHIGIASGAITASQDIIRLTIEGKGSHGASPELGIDPILVASEVVSSIHHVVSRSISPFERGVISFGQFHSGDIFNIIPDTAFLEGNVRTSDEGIRRKIKERVEEVVSGICQAYGATYKLDYDQGYSPVVNDEEATSFAMEAARSAIGEECIFTDPQKMVSEDFSEYTKKLQGCFMILGGGEEKDGFEYMNHHPKFIINEEALKAGLSTYVKLVEQHTTK